MSDFESLISRGELYKQQEQQREREREAWRKCLGSPDDHILFAPTTAEWLATVQDVIRHANWKKQGKTVEVYTGPDGTTRIRRYTRKASSFSQRLASGPVRTVKILELQGVGPGRESYCPDTYCAIASNGLMVLSGDGNWSNIYSGQSQEEWQKVREMFAFQIGQAR